MRLKKSVSKNSTSWCIIKDYSKHGHRSTKVVHSIGNIENIKKSAEAEGIEYTQWLNNYLNKYIEEHSDNKEEVIIKKKAGKLIPKDTRFLYNIGHLFLENIYYDLKLNEIAKSISDKYKFEFDLNDILSCLIYSRIIYPSSKLKTHKLSKQFLKSPAIDLHNIYRALTYMSKEMDFIQAKLYENSLNVIERNSRAVYFDVTNYYFEIYEEDNFKKYGVNKQHRPKPQVSMGLFMDGDGIPLAMNIFSGNESETRHLIPDENKIVQNFKLKDSRIVICTDAAMCTDEIKSFNIKDGRGFVITQSIKKIKSDYQKEALNQADWRIGGDLKNIYNINTIENNEELHEKYYNTLFYKIIPTETASVKQDLIVTFSFKYKDYHRSVRNSQIKRATEKINKNPKNEKIKLNHNQNDYRRFINEIAVDKNNEETKTYNYSINDDLIKNEEKYDGYYGLTTNLNDDIKVILDISNRRWEIEESFRILKHDFLARPVELSREDRITSHFLTCYISLLIYRILEKKLDYKYTTSEILNTLKDMYVHEFKGEGYSAVYVRTDLTDDLHEAFGFRTDYELASYNYFDKIFRQVKKPK